MRLSSLGLIAGLGAIPATAATVNVTLPRLSVAEYKRPYVAGWIEPAGGGTARTVFVWYDVRKADNAGAKWLGDLRSWWRKGGRSLNLPANGISGATKGAGSYPVTLPADLVPGQYVLSIEAAREHGGRELITLPLSIPAKAASASGKTELGAVTLSAR